MAITKTQVGGFLGIGGTQVTTYTGADAAPTPGAPLNPGSYYKDSKGYTFQVRKDGSYDYNYQGSSANTKKDLTESAATNAEAAATLEADNAKNPTSDKAKKDSVTKEKLQILYRTDPGMALKLANMFHIVIEDVNKVAGTINKAAASIDKPTKLVAQNIFKFETEAATKVAKTTSSINTGIQKGVDTITGALDNLSKDLHEDLKPLSSVTGTTLGAIKTIAKDPTGAPEYLARTIGDLIRKVNPGFADKMDASAKNLKLNNLQHLPDQIMGSVRNIMTAFDAILSVPLSLVSDLYNGLMDLMQQISEAIDQVEAAVQKFFFGPGGLLDSAFPDLLETLDAVNELAGYATGISQTFSGFNQVASVALQVTSYSNQLQSFINNPLNLASAYIPNQVSQGLYAIQNPQNIINQYLPPQLSQGFAQISKITGFGFNGNMGFGLQSVLDGLQGGVIHSVVGNFAKQYAILTPLLNLTPGVPTASVPIGTTQPVALIQSPTNPNQQLANSIPYNLNKNTQKLLETK